MTVVVWLVAGFFGDFFLGAYDSEFDYGNLPKDLLKLRNHILVSLLC